MIRVRAWGLLAGAAMSAAACTVGPAYHAPEAPAGAAAPLATGDPAAASAEAPPDDWWRLYEDPRLDHLLAAAFAANADLAAAQANLTAAGAFLRASRAARYPDTALLAGGSYGRDPATDEILELGGHRPTDTWVLEDFLQVSYEVDLFGHVRRTVEAAGASAGAAVAARDAVKVTVAAETARAYAQVCSLGQQIAVARHSLAVVDHEREITAQREQAGAGSRFDLARAQGLAAQARSAIAPLEGQRRAALYQLTALLGRTPAFAPAEVDDCVAPLRLSRPIPVGDGALLLRRRPDIRQAERNLASATARIGVATADLYPRIRLDGFYGGAAANLKDLTSEPGLAWGIGPAVSWNFPNQAGARARVRQAQANAAAALAAFDSVVLTALKETQQALAAYNAELEHHRWLRDAQQNAQGAFAMAHERFLAGSISNLDLLTSEQALVTADAAVAAAETALVQDQIAVFKALGGGWQADPQEAPRSGPARIEPLSRNSGPAGPGP